MLEVEEQWRQFLKGDMEAFEKVLNIHFKDLFYYGSKFSKNQEFVKDAIQDLFLNLWEKRGNLSDDIPVKAYLMASLRRIMHRSALVQTKIPGIPLEANSQVFEVELSIEHKWIEQESTEQRAQKIKTSIEELPARQKEVIYLKYFQELNRSQISEIMGVSPQTVSNLLQIALGQLKKHFKVEFLTFFFFYFQ
tara:strand:+ start:1062 stop:1640 length:579 start_codon:yes stop_codon:yes gene_type:complete